LPFWIGFKNVQTAPDTELIQFDDWTLRIRRTPHPSPRLLLLVHGLTGDENSMWVFARDLPPNYWIIAPRAPYPAEQGGFTWRRFEMSTFGRPTLEELSPAAEALIRLVDAYSASAGFEAGVFDLLGFSQGAAVCNVIVFRYPQRVRRTGILAGFVPAGLEGLAEERPLEGKPFFVAHGTKDQTVPIDRARDSIKVLERAGAQVTFCEDEVGHKVSLACMRALRDFLLH
jgi:phospholipase/carboxylesterase